MNRKLFMTILVALFLFFTAPNILPDTDILGWGKVRWGMTHSQVAKLYDLEDWWPEDPNRCYAKNTVNIQGHDFMIMFWFDKRSPKGKLYRVKSITSKEKASGEIYNSIAGLLQSKYGKPDSDQVRKDTEIYVPTVRTSLWLKKSGQIEFQTFSSLTSSGSPRKALCSITYISVGSEIDKL
jgi:hypothetical protein